MLQNCAPVCKSCDQIEEEGESDCFEDLVDAWEPGDIEKTFRRLTSEPYLSEYDVEVLSSPETTGGSWVITLDNAVSDEEAQLLIEAGTDIGFARSTTKDAFGNEADVTSGRTSSTAFCNEEECYTEPRIRAITDRLANFSGIPADNQEHLQFLQYQLGQKYDVHHDMIPGDVMAPQGRKLSSLLRNCRHIANSHKCPLCILQPES